MATQSLLVRQGHFHGDFVQHVCFVTRLGPRIGCQTYLGLEVGWQEKSHTLAWQKLATACIALWPEMFLEGLSADMAK